MLKHGIDRLAARAQLASKVTSLGVVEFSGSSVTS